MSNPSRIASGIPKFNWSKPALRPPSAAEQSDHMFGEISTGLQTQIGDNID